MQLAFLGTGGFHPTDRRHTAALMIPELGLGLDAGTGLFRLQKWLRTETLDLYLSHAHLDHVVGLTFLLEVFGRHDAERVTIHAEDDKLAAVAEHLFARLLFPVAPGYRFVPLRGTQPVAGGGTLTTFPLEHPGGAVGMRFDWPHTSLAYVTDTTAHPQAEYLRYLRGVKLLVHEANFPDGYAEQAVLTGHSCLGAVAEVAKLVGAEQLAVVHSDPLLARDHDFDLTTARQTFANLVMPRDGDVLEF